MRSVVVLLAALALGGCFDLREDFTFNDDGTVAFTTVVRQSAAFPADWQTPEVCNPSFHAAVAEARTYTVEADNACELSGLVSIDELQAFLAERDVEDGEPLARLIQVDDGYRLVVRIDPSLHLGGLETGDDMEGFAGGLLQAAFADRSLVWTVAAAEILDTDGTVNADRTEATVSIPMSVLLNGEPQEITRFIEFRVTPLSLWQRLFR